MTELAEIVEQPEAVELDKHLPSRCQGDYCILRGLILEKDIPSYLKAGAMSKPAAVSSDVLFDVCDGCVHMCVRKEIASREFDQRMIEQEKCKDDFKWILSEKAGEDVGGEIARILWVKRGFAERFARAYESGCSNKHWEIYTSMEKSSPFFWDSLVRLAGVLKRGQARGNNLYAFDWNAFNRGGFVEEMSPIQQEEMFNFFEECGMAVSHEGW